MARIRTIKPAFFMNESVGALPIEWRLLFIGLWTQADRAGRLEDRPRRIWAALFPYDKQVDVDQGLNALVEAGLITRYGVNGQKLIAIPTWAKHQIPQRKESPSTLPGPSGEDDRLGVAPTDKQRQAIYERDGFRCVYCRRDMAHAREARMRCVDHVVPIARGGTHNAVNLATACKKCNGKKAHHLPTDAGLPWPAGLGEYLDGGPVTGGVNPRPTLSGGSANVNGGLTLGVPPRSDQHSQSARRGGTAPVNGPRTPGYALGNMDHRITGSQDHRNVPPNPPRSAKGARLEKLTRAERKTAEHVRKSEGGCRHTPHCRTYTGCLLLITQRIRDRRMGAEV